MIGVIAGGRSDQLQSDIAPQPFIPRPKNLAHGSRADFLQDSVVTYDLARHAQVRPAGMLGRIGTAVNTGYETLPRSSSMDLCPWSLVSGYSME